MSLNVQQDLGFGTVLSVGYVGNLSRHLTGEQNINEVPYGAEYLAQNQNPASPGTPLPDNFFRPYPGYGSITYRTTNLTANYNSMQVQVTRRFRREVAYGITSRPACFSMVGRSPELLTISAVRLTPSASPPPIA